MLRIAINGYGRIGRNFHRHSLNSKTMQVVAINSRSSAESRAHLLKYDSVHGRLNHEVKVLDHETFAIDGQPVKCLTLPATEKFPWQEMGIDIVIEAIGWRRTDAMMQIHLESGAKYGIITAPRKDEGCTIVMGVNDQTFDPEKNKIISNASCTTNCLAPVAKVIDEHFGIETGFLTTIHAVTNSQNLLDNSTDDGDMRRARCATMSMIPTTTGAAKAVGLVLPQLKGKVDGMAVRVPTETVSLCDFVVKCEKPVTKEKINQAFLEAEQGNLRGILGTSNEPLVSIDFKSDSRSAIVDLGLTQVLKDGHTAKVFAWYDNEWAYALRLVDLIELIDKRAKLS